MRNPFRGLTAVLYKEALHVRRDSTALLFALFIPILQMILFGFGIDTNIRRIKTVVYDTNGQRESRELVDRLRNSDTFWVVGYVQSDQQLNEAIVSGRARVGVKIPVDYSNCLLKGRTAHVLVLIDGSDSSVAGQALNVSTAIGLNESLKRVLGPRQELPVDIRARLLFNPDSRTPNFFLPGLTAVMLLSVTTFLTAFSIVREKEKGTLEQLFVTPVKPLGLLVGKILPYLGIGFTELCAMLLFMRAVFQVPIHGHMLSLLFLSLPYLFVALSLGMLISTTTNSQSEAMQLSYLTMLPSIFFSGYIFPRETMPLPFWLLSFAVPATYFINIMRGIILRGAGIAHLWVDALVLVGMGVGLLLFAAKRFQKKVIIT